MYHLSSESFNRLNLGNIYHFNLLHAYLNLERFYHLNLVNEYHLNLESACQCKSLFSNNVLLR